MPDEHEGFEISATLGSELVQYLRKQPYFEVAGLIQQIQTAARVGLEKNKNEVLPPATPPAPAKEGAQDE